MYLCTYFLTMHMYIGCINYIFLCINVSLSLATSLQSMWDTLCLWIICDFI
jgi:hypothetical protein